MKKTILFSSVLVALAMLASCQKEEFIETPATATGVTEFTATIESTKTTIASDGKVTWTAGDEITVTDAASKSAVYVAASSGATTTFTLKQGQTAVGAGPYKATYGDINNQKYSANGANCPLKATTTDASSKNLQFSSPYAVLKITAKSSNSDVIKTVVVTYGDNGSFLDCGDGVTLTNEGVDFYVAIEPANAKLSVAFYNTADKMAKKTRTESISLAAKNLLPVTFDLSDWGTPIFKAVLDASNNLTFYYDTQDYSGDGITIYQNGASNYLLDQSKSNNKIWGYYDKSTNITGVVIDPSVAGYKGLTSTAYMFYNMTNASRISGAEHLDVSGVTNMVGMFFNFGSASTTLKDVPKVSGWNTGLVTNMSSMFQSYGSKNVSFNDVPDVSKWDTRNVTNMNSMFKSFASISTELECAPKVNGTNWNTVEVTDMSGMFRDYGKASEKLKEAPDVSSWNTQKVTKMGDLFYGYGHNSGNLKAAPEVDNWDTGNVTSVTNLFWDYGNGSASFNLDLSKWDLSKITSDGNVFKCAPAAFNVKIPAKTGTKQNYAKKWYYGPNGANGAIEPPSDKKFSDENGSPLPDEPTQSN